MMSIILADLPGVQTYLDDITCYGATQEEHDANLRRVLRALSDAGLKPNINKRNFNQSSLNYLMMISMAIVKVRGEIVQPAMLS